MDAGWALVSRYAGHTAPIFCGLTLKRGGRYKTNFLLADVVVVVVVAVGVVVVNPQLLVIFNGVNISIKCQLLLVNKYMMYQ